MTDDGTEALSLKLKRERERERQTMLQQSEQREVVALDEGEDDDGEEDDGREYYE